MSKIVVIIGFLISFVAGVTVGRRVLLPANANVTRTEELPQTPGPATTQSAKGQDRDRGGWLNEVLSLTPEQQAQMKTIWSETAQHGRREREERRQALRKDRDELIAKLMLESGRKDEFDWIYTTYEQKVAALDAEWRGKFEAAVEKTKAILTPEQRTKYDEILSRHAPQPGGERGNDPKHRPATRDTRDVSAGSEKPQTSRETPQLH